MSADRRVLVDTSAWVEFLRGTGSPTHRRLRSLIESGAEVCTTEPVIMEILAGARRPRTLTQAEALTNGLPLLPIEPGVDFRNAAQLARASAANGHPIRSQVDCLIAAVVIRRDVALLANDRDYEYLAAISPLRLFDAR